jgi:hypothetical protein
MLLGQNQKRERIKLRSNYQSMNDDIENLTRRGVDSRVGVPYPMATSQEQGTQPISYCKTRAASPRTQDDSLAGSFTQESPRARLVNRMGDGSHAPLVLNAQAISNDPRRPALKEYVEVGSVHQGAAHP